MKARTGRPLQTKSLQNKGCYSHDSLPLLVQAGVEGVFGGLAFVDLVDDVLDEVGVSVGDDGLVLDGLGFFAGPCGLSGGTVSVEAGTGCGDPVAEEVAGVGEVAVSSQGCGTVLFGVIGAEPVQVQRGQFPDQFGVAMPVLRRH